MDDFIGLETSRERTIQAYEVFHDLTVQLGLDLAQKKCMPPATAITWLGFRRDSISMTVTIPEAKLAAILSDYQT